MEAIDGDEAAAVLGNDAMVTMTTEDVDLYSPGAADGVPDAAERAASRNSSHDTVTGDEDTATVLPGPTTSPYEEELIVTVKDPKKHTEGTFSSSYVTYTVVSKASGDNVQLFGFEEATVLRRYSDFLWLRLQMVRENPGHIIPPMPPKHSMERNKYDPIFLETRRAALERFIVRLAKHPVLSMSKPFCIFLKAKAHELITAKKVGESSLVDEITMSAMVLQIKLMTKPPTDERFLKMRDHNLLIEGIMKQIETTCVQSTKATSELSKVASDFSAALLKLGETEAVLGPFLSSMKDVFEKQIEALEISKLAQSLKMTEPTREYILYADSIRDVLQRRDNVEREYHVMCQLLKEKQKEQEDVSTDDQKTSFGAILGGKPEDVKRDKLARINTDLEELKESMERCHDYTTEINGKIIADMERWHESKNLDLLTMLEGMADSQMAYSNGMISAWNAALDV